MGRGVPGPCAVVYGHTPVTRPEWINNTLCVDTGCVFGGSLSALRWPEREVVSVPALAEHYPPARPSRPVPTGAGLAVSELDLADVLGTLRIETRLGNSVTVRETQTGAALEVMSRFAADPRWLVYLPPTMAPVATSTRADLLEHPDEAFAQYREDGVDVVVCEEKHMGSRAVVIVSRDDSVAPRRFGVEGSGRILTRTGRAFFGDPAVEAALLDRLRQGLERAGMWDELRTDWLVIDSELLPWSAKAAELLRTQYAAVGASARASLGSASELLTQALGRGLDIGALAESVSARHGMAESFVTAYRRYCWTVSSLEDLRLAPFQILAGEGAVHALQPHTWHLGLIDRLCETAPETLRRTERRVVALADDAAVAEATEWWEALTAAGGEGMVVKPDAVVVATKRGLAQPGVKVRGREYLRIIYGPDYTMPANLDRLRPRGLAHKRSLAAREFALGIESLERFVAGEPLHRVHPPVFAVLALESDPVDPRL